MNALVAAPAGPAVVVAVVAALVAWVLLGRAVRVSRPPRPIEIGDQRPEPDPQLGLEPPAVVGLLTNGDEVPSAAVVATVLDLARRGWVRLAVSDDGELVVFTRGRGRHGDVLRGFEQQVLNHLTARSFDGVTTASTLMSTASRLNRRWWRRFRRDVVRAGRERGLTRQRFTSGVVLAPMVAVTVAAVALHTAVNPGAPERDVASSLVPRAVWWLSALLVVAVAVGVVRRFASSAEFPTELGERRAGEWLGYRARLVATVPDGVTVVAPPDQQLALAYAAVTGLCPEVTEQLPIVGEDHRQAWSDAGGIPHVVRVRYPLRPGYGRNPWLMVALGAAVVLAARWAQGYLGGVDDGEALTALVDNLPEQADIIERVAAVLVVVLWIPIVWAGWAVLAGVVDSVWANQRIGAIVRVRRPVDVVPQVRLLRSLAERDRFSVYMAVDDGRRRTVTAWRANERTAAPQGAFARVRATALLGYVRSSEPVGTSTRVAP
ncbi:MAG: hypothetical protein WD225_00805 [Ilumatobacteraceae bacterium]